MFNFLIRLIFTCNLLGIVVLSFDLTLHNVYYVPDFKINLLSMSTLLHDCNVSFHSDSFVIQGNRSLKTIGKGELVDGLYIFKHSPQPGAPSPVVHESDPSINIISIFSHSHVNNVSYSIWHSSLGHPSHRMLLVLSDKLLGSSNN